MARHVKQRAVAQADACFAVLCIGLAIRVVSLVAIHRLREHLLGPDEVTDRYPIVAPTADWCCTSRGLGFNGIGRHRDRHHGREGDEEQE